MNYPENRRMFTIRELAKACGVSRSTLIRMEECGFLTPCYTDPETGYRYYDAQNAAHVGQFLLLQQLGLTRAEITDCYFQIEKTKEMLQKQRARLFLMQRTLEELEVRVNPAHNFSCSFLDLPETVCYCERQMISSPDESEQFFFSIHEKCISEGFRLMGTEPIFGLSKDDYRMLGIGPQEVTACIPIVPSERNDPHIASFPPCRAFSMLAYGDYRVLNELCARFWKEFDRRGLKAAGPARFIGLVAPYVGNHLLSKDFCYRLVVPVQKEG